MAVPGVSAKSYALTAGARKPFVLAPVLGILHALAFAPFGRWWFALLVLAGLSALLVGMIREERSTGAVAFAAGLFGFGWFGAGVGWLFISLHTYGGMPAPIAALAIALFAGYLGLFPALAAGLCSRLGTARWKAHQRAVGRAEARVRAGSVGIGLPILLASLLTLGELARGFIFTGFSWLAIGYSQTDGPLAGFAAIGGVYLVGLVACLSAALAASALLDRRFTLLVPAIALLLAGAALGKVAWSEASGPALAVRLIQGNVAQRMKFEPSAVLAAMARYTELIEAGPAELIILPETAWTMPWSSTPAPIAARIERFVEATDSAVAIGMPLVEAPRPEELARGSTLSNSVLLFDQAVFAGAHPPARYDKHHLVPFGEFVPWGFRWFVDLMTIPLGDFARGELGQPSFAVAGQRVAFNICYEDAFGEELLPSIRGSSRGDGGATILANVSNIAWFGNSHALPQHLQIARMRSLETARPMLRATNTGVTAAIDFDGTVLGELPPYREGTLAVTVQGRRGLTPYVRTGNWAVLLVALMLALAGAAAARQAFDLGANRSGRTR